MTTGRYDVTIAAVSPSDRRVLTETTFSLTVLSGSGMSKVFKEKFFTVTVSKGNFTWRFWFSLKNFHFLLSCHIGLFAFFYSLPSVQESSFCLESDFLGFCFGSKLLGNIKPKFFKLLFWDHFLCCSDVTDDEFTFNTPELGYLLFVNCGIAVLNKSVFWK